MTNTNFASFFFSVLALSSCLSAPRAGAQEPAPPPDSVHAIENFVVPPELFPGGELPGAHYSPIPAYDRPFGKRIGKVSVQTECTQKTDDGECWYPLQRLFERYDGRRFQLEQGEVDYEEPALVSYHRAVRNGDKAWSQVEYAGGAFWIETDATAVRNYESLTSWINDVETWCTEPGVCQPVNGAMRAQIDRVKAGEIQLGCGDVIYNITGIVHHGASRYYKVELIEEHPAPPTLKLPKTGYIPTRRHNGEHASTFYSRGC